MLTRDYAISMMEAAQADQVPWSIVGDVLEELGFPMADAIRNCVTITLGNGRFRTSLRILRLMAFAWLEAEPRMWIELLFHRRRFGDRRIAFEVCGLDPAELRRRAAEWVRNMGKFRIDEQMELDP